MTEKLAMLRCADFSGNEVYVPVSKILHVTRSGGRRNKMCIHYAGEKGREDIVFCDRRVAGRVMEFLG